MRVEANTELGMRSWFIWDCEKCYRPLCVWIDSDTAQYLEVVKARPYREQVKQAKRITIDVGTMTILINPKEIPCDTSDDTVTETCSSATA